MEDVEQASADYRPAIKRSYAGPVLAPMRSRSASVVNTSDLGDDHHRAALSGDVELDVVSSRERQREQQGIGTTTLRAGFEVR